MVLYENRVTKVAATKGTLKQVYAFRSWGFFAHAEAGQAHAVVIPFTKINSTHIGSFLFPDVWLTFAALIGFFAALTLGALIGDWFSEIANGSALIGAVSAAAFTFSSGYFLKKGKGWQRWVIGLGGLVLSIPLASQALYLGFGDRFSLLSHLIPMIKFGISSRYWVGWLAGAGITGLVCYQFLKGRKWFNVLSVLTIGSSSSSIRVAGWNSEVAKLLQLQEEVSKLCEWDRRETPDSKALAS